MKKLFLSLMVACLSLGSGVAMAQNAASKECEKQGTCCAADAKECKNNKDKKDKKAKDVRKLNRQQPDFFQGVQLTPDQQERLAVLRQGLGPAIVPGMDTLKNATGEQKRQMREQQAQQRVESKKNYLNGVKEVLSPDQYVLFLENVYMFSDPQQGSANSMRSKDFRGKAKDSRAPRDRKDIKERKDMKDRKDKEVKDRKDRKEKSEKK